MSLLYRLLLSNLITIRGGQLLIKSTCKGLVVSTSDHPPFFKLFLGYCIRGLIPLVVCPLLVACWYDRTNFYFMGLFIVTCGLGLLFRATLLTFGIQWFLLLGTPLDKLELPYRQAYAQGTLWVALAAAVMAIENNHMFFDSFYHLLQCLLFGVAPMHMCVSLRYFFFRLVYTEKELTEEGLFVLGFFFLGMLPLMIIHSISQPVDLVDWLGGSRVK